MCISLTKSLFFGKSVSITISESKILLSLMSQYQPFYRAGEFKEINRKITQREYDRVLYAVEELGFENVLVQNFDSADEKYVPLFDFEGLDF